MGAILETRPGHEKNSSRWAARGVAVLSAWVERSRQRKALALLADDDHLLDDIGVSRRDALHEAAKPFWRR